MRPQKYYLHKKNPLYTPNAYSLQTQLTLAVKKYWRSQTMTYWVFAQCAKSPFALQKSVNMIRNQPLTLWGVPDHALL